MTQSWLICQSLHGLTLFETPISQGWRLFGGTTPILVSFETIREECASAAIARHQSISIELFKGIIVVCFQHACFVALTTHVGCDHWVITLRFRREWSALMGRLLSLNVFPLFLTLRHMNVNAGRPVLLPTNVAHNSARSLKIIRHFSNQLNTSVSLLLHIEGQTYLCM